MNFETSTLIQPPSPTPFSWLTMIFSPLSRVIWQYAPAFGSVTNLPTFPIYASREWTKFWRRQEPLGPGRKAGVKIARQRRGGNR